MTGVVVEYADVILIRSTSGTNSRLVLGKPIASIPVGVYDLLGGSSEVLTLGGLSLRIHELPYDRLPAPILAEILHDLRPENYKPIHGGKPAPDHGGTP